MDHNVLHFERTSSGSFRQLRNKEIRTRGSNNAQSTDAEKLILKLKKEWQRKYIDTKSLDKVHGVISTLNTTEAKDFSKRMVTFFQEFVQNKSVKGVLKKVTNNDLSKILKNLTSNEDSSELLNTMLSNPDMKKEAMNLMKEMLSDEKKFEQMTNMMSNMMNKKEEEES